MSQEKRWREEAHVPSCFNIYICYTYPDKLLNVKRACRNKGELNLESQKQRAGSRPLPDTFLLTRSTWPGVFTPAVPETHISPAVTDCPSGSLLFKLRQESNIVVRGFLSSGRTHILGKLASLARFLFFLQSVMSGRCQLFRSSSC